MKSEKDLRTTINFEFERIEYLKKKCDENGLDVLEVIRQCVALYIKEMNKKKFEYGTLTYQDKAPQWVKVHFSMSDIEYDIYLDVKKVQRLSFSHIVAIAIDRYLDEVLNGEEKNSYPIVDYSKHCIDDNNSTKYEFLWIKSDVIPTQRE
jgi:uncharacterized protein YlbG (UPF0298 family)